MSWEDNDFPDADDGNNVEYMLVTWRTVECYSKCGGNYFLDSRQFEHLPKGATEEEARERLAFYEKMHLENSKGARKNHSIFLCKVVDVAQITDKTGKVIDHG